MCASWPHRPTVVLAAGGDQLTEVLATFWPRGDAAAVHNLPVNRQEQEQWARAEGGVGEVGAKETLPGPLATLLLLSHLVSPCSPSVSACFFFLSSTFRQLKILGRSVKIYDDYLAERWSGKGYCCSTRRQKCLWVK